MVRIWKQGETASGLEAASVWARAYAPSGGALDHGRPAQAQAGALESGSPKALPNRRALN